MEGEDKENNTKATRQEVREEKLRKKKQKMKLYSPMVSLKREISSLESMKSCPVGFGRRRSSGKEGAISRSLSRRQSS